MKLQVILMLIAGLLFYTLVDILIWQRIFEAKSLVAIGVGIYHLGYVLVLLGFIVIGVIALLPNIKMSLVYSVCLAILGFSGWEDILYYWLDGRVIPWLLPWLNNNPLIFFHPVTSIGLIISAIFWLIIVVVIIYLA